MNKNYLIILLVRKKHVSLHREILNINLMVHQVTIKSETEFSFSEYINMLGVDDLVLTITPDDETSIWGFYRKSSSTSLFLIEKRVGEYIVSMDALASYDDYLLFPYLVDSLSICLKSTPYLYNNESAFAIYDEKWVEESIGEEIAYIKCVLSLGAKYYIELPKTDNLQFLTESILNQYGVTIYSSTSRIYGYIQYLLKSDLLPCDDDYDNINIGENCDGEIFIDVPQHVSIGVVKSWQTDGAETTESYSEEDVQLLLKIGSFYKEGRGVHGYVLNDIGTIYEYGIGVNQNYNEAIYWYKEAMRHGDHLYAPTSLGDIYRRGYDDVQPDFSLALEAYKLSDDPYSWYRIGQSFEEGWCGRPDLAKAHIWYKKAAEVGHHLAIMKFQCTEEN